MLKLLKILKTYGVTITISVSFFVFGFFVTAGTLGLSSREIITGLVSGAIGGITTLVVTMLNSRELSAHLHARLYEYPPPQQ